MKTAQARLITPNDHPPEITVFEAETIGDAWRKANDALWNGAKPQQAAIWQFKESQNQESLNYSLSDIFETTALAGYLNREAQPFAMESVHRYTADGMNAPRLNPSENSPFLLQMLSFIQASQNLKLRMGVTVEKNRDADIYAHFDDEKISRVNGQRRLLERLLKKKSNTLRDRTMHVVWNEKAGADDERVGTLFWPSIHDSGYVKLLNEGRLGEASSYANAYAGLNQQNAWQMPKRSVAFMLDGGEPRSLALHSGARQRKPAANETPAIMHRLDVEYSEHNKTPSHPANLLA